MKKTRNIIQSDHGEWLEVNVSTEKHPSSVMKIDSEDWSLLQQMNIGRISMTSNGYAQARLGGRVVRIHRVILPDSDCIDHVNHDKLDNRRCNIWACTHIENALNKGGSSQSVKADGNKNIKHIGAHMNEEKKGWMRATDVRGCYGISRPTLNKLVEKGKIRRSRLSENKQCASLYCVEDIEGVIDAGIEKRERACA